MIIQRGQLGWLGHVTRIGKERLSRKIYESKEYEKGKEEDREWMRMDGRSERGMCGKRRK